MNEDKTVFANKGVKKLDEGKKISDPTEARLALGMLEHAHHLDEEERERIRARAHEVLKKSQKERGVVSEYDTNEFAQ